MFAWRVDDEISFELLEPRHAEALFLLSDQNRKHLRRWLGWVDGTQTVDDSRAFIHSTQQQWAANNGYTVAILYRGELAGNLGHHPIRHSQRAVELGYWLGAAFEGKGIMTRACQAFVSETFRMFGLNKVEIRAATGNLHSQRVAERLGFVREGHIRDAEWLYDHYVDHYLYGMLARDWQAS